MRDICPTYAPDFEGATPGLYAVSVDFTVHALSVDHAEEQLRSLFAENAHVAAGIYVSAVRDDHTSLVSADDEDAAATTDAPATMTDALISAGIAEYDITETTAGVLEVATNTGGRVVLDRDLYGAWRWTAYDADDDRLSGGRDRDADVVTEEIVRLAH